MTKVKFTKKIGKRSCSKNIFSVVLCNNSYYIVHNIFSIIRVFPILMVPYGLNAISEVKYNSGSKLLICPFYDRFLQSDIVFFALS